VAGLSAALGHEAPTLPTHPFRLPSTPARVSTAKRHNFGGGSAPRIYDPVSLSDAPVPEESCLTYPSLHRIRQARHPSRIVDFLQALKAAESRRMQGAEVDSLTLKSPLGRERKR
jgi:hypothetical protein